MEEHGEATSMASARSTVSPGLGHTTTAPSYTLQALSELFLGRGKEDMKIETRTRSNSAEERAIIHDRVKSERGPYSNRSVPTEKIWEEVEEVSKHWKNRQAFQALYSCAIPSKEAVARIAELAESKPGMSVISVGAGLGLWERLIHEQIVHKDDHRVTALEISEKLLSLPAEDTYYPLTKGDVGMDSLSRLEPNNNAILFICWPHKGTMVESLRKFMPEYVVYVGEPDPDGVNEGEEFFNELEGHHFQLVEEIKIDQWFGLNDTVGIYKSII